MAVFRVWFPVQATGDGAVRLASRRRRLARRAGVKSGRNRRGVTWASLHSGRDGSNCSGLPGRAPISGRGGRGCSGYLGGLLFENVGRLCGVLDRELANCIRMPPVGRFGREGLVVRAASRCGRWLSAVRVRGVPGLCCVGFPAGPASRRDTVCRRVFLSADRCGVRGCVRDIPFGAASGRGGRREAFYSDFADLAEPAAR